MRCAGRSIPGRTDIKVGNLWVWTERTTWNPVGGFGDVYSTDIARNLNDPPLINDHHSPASRIRSGPTITSRPPVPTGRCRCPADAVRLGSGNDVWAPVAAGTTAKSKVSFDYSLYFQRPLAPRSNRSRWPT